MTIPDLAEAIAPGLKTDVIGIRPGEKLHEIMIGEDDARHSVEFDDCYVIAPETKASDYVATVPKLLDAGGAMVADDFMYTSDRNDQWLGVGDLRALFEKLGI